MKSTLLLVLVLYSISACSQKLNYKDLVFGLNHTIHDSKNMLLKKGFTFSNVVKTDSWKHSSQMHLFSTKNAKSGFLTFGVEAFGANIYSTNLTTSKQSEYLMIQNQVKAGGFKLISPVTNPKQSRIDYQNDDLTIVFFVDSIQNYILYKVRLESWDKVMVAAKARGKAEKATADSLLEANKDLIKTQKQ